MKGSHLVVQFIAQKSIPFIQLFGLYLSPLFNFLASMLFFMGKRVQGEVFREGLFWVQA